MADIISPRTADELIRTQQAVLIDVREPEEYRSLHIPSALLQPLSVLDLLPEDHDKDKPAIYFCHSGRRTTAHRNMLDRRGHTAAYIIDGGIAAWQLAGLPVRRGSGPIAMNRQIRIAAGSFILLFLLLGQKFLAALVGAGLLYSGLSGTCGMAALLQRMPWNRSK